MYNYNTNEGGAGAFIRDLVIKLIFVIILVLLLIWLFPMPNMQPFYDRIYTENIVLMKDSAKSYYTVERLPVKVDDKVTMTLGEMIDKHLILNLTDKNGKTCSTNDSYVEVTKLETEYALKVYLTCGDEEDYIVEYMGCYDLCEGEDCKEVPVVTPTKTVVKKVAAKPLTNTVVKVVTKTNTVIKTVIKEVPAECPECEECEECEEEECDEPETETWVLYGKDTETDITDWITTKKNTGSTTTNGVTTTISLYDSKDEDGEASMEEEEATVYSCAWLPVGASLPYTLNYSDNAGTRLLNLDELGLSDEAQDLSRSDLDLEIDDWDYFSSSDYSRYVSEAGEKLYVAGGTPSGTSSTSAGTIEYGSLKSSNFTITSISASWNSSHDTYEVRTVARITNVTGAKSSYDPKIDRSLYYVPHKFTVTWNEPTEEDGETFYKYKTVVSYKDIWVLKGSAQEKELIDDDYEAKQTKIVEK